MWEIIFALSLPALSCAALAGNLVWANRKRLRYWQETAEFYGLQVEETSSARTWHL